jgi:hypothetical protein
MKNNNWDVMVVYAAILAGALLLMYIFINLMIDNI